MWLLFKQAKTNEKKDSKKAEIGINLKEIHKPTSTEI